jgi:hypothetical protein
MLLAIRRGSSLVGTLAVSASTLFWTEVAASLSPGYTPARAVFKAAVHHSRSSIIAPAGSAEHGANIFKDTGGFSWVPPLPAQEARPKAAPKTAHKHDEF